LFADDKAKYQLNLELGDQVVTVSFDPIKAVAEVNGKRVGLICVQPSYQAQIGELQFAQPDLDLDFRVLKNQHVLQQQVEASGFAKATD